MITTTNIASHLPKMAKQQPDTWAVVLQAKHRQQTANYEQALTYKQLDEASNLVAAGLLASGVNKGSRVVVMVKPGLDFFILVFAIFKIGAVLVAIDPGMGIKNLGKCLAEAEPDVFIGIASAHFARMILRWGSSTIKHTILAGKHPIFSLVMTTLNTIQQKAKGQQFEFSETRPEDIAAILFTSGSTGIPKGVIYNHENFIAQVEALKQLYNIQPGEIDLATFPLFALFAPALGMTSIIPVMDFTRPGDVNPEKIVDAVIDYQCTNMFGSPALLNRVGKHYQKLGIKLISLKRVLSAGAPVSASILKTFSGLLNDDVQIFTPYGATESLPVSSIGSQEVIRETSELTAKGKGVCVGKIVETIDVKIIGITDKVISNCSEANFLNSKEVGEICVKGPQVTAAYYNREKQTHLAKIKTDDGFYHRIGDVGYIDDQGRLWYCGRKSQRIVTTSETLYTECCEGIFNQHEAVYRTALVKVEQNSLIIPVICIELENQLSSEQQQLLILDLKQLANNNEMTKQIYHFFIHPAFPVDIRHNAKIAREKLGEWAQAQLR